ncbi:MAG: VCBS domain-containing protein, partial [Roseococcus sp.]
KVDSFTVEALDGTAKQIDFSIHGADDAPLAIDSQVVVGDSWGATAIVQLTAAGIGPLTYAITTPLAGVSFGPMSFFDPVAGTAQVPLGHSLAGTTDFFQFTVSNAFGTSAPGTVSFSRLAGYQPLSLTAGDGNDIFFMPNGKATLHSGGGDDLIYLGFVGVPTEGYVIDAGAGNDTILAGWGGSDTLRGGAGADDVNVGTSNKTLILAPGETSGDIIREFDGAGAAVGDMLQLQGYGPGATLDQLGSNWTIHYAGEAESFTFVGLIAFDPTTDVIWV